MSIKHDMLHGVFWSAVEKYSGLIVSTIVAAILSRILTPAEYGVVSIASVLIAFLGMFASMGMAPAIIQRQDLTDEDLDSIYTFSLFLAVVLSSVLFCSSGLISRHYDNPQLIPICRLLSVNLFFAALNVVPNALMMKNKRFKEVAQRTLLLQICTGVLSILAALLGAGVYALLISPIFTAVGIFIYNRRYYHCHFTRAFSIEPIKRIFSYSIFQFAFEFVNYFSRNLDKLVIARFMSPESLGYYDKSYRLMQLPMQNIASVVKPVMQPVLASLQDNNRQMASEYNKIVKVMATISFPLGIALFFIAPELIRCMFGSQWGAAVPAFKILALSLPLQMVVTTSGSVFQSSNATKDMFVTGVLSAAITVTGFLFAAKVFGTIEAIAWSWTISTFLSFTLTYIWMYAKVLHTSLWSMLAQLLKPLLIAVIMAAVMLGIEALHLQWNVWIMFFFKGAVEVLLALSLIQITGQYDILGSIKSYLAGRKNG